MGKILNMKKTFIFILALAAVTVLAQFTTSLQTSVKITGTPNTDDKRWLRLVVSNENLRRLNAGDPVLATNLLPESTGGELKSSAEIAISNVVAVAIQSWSEQAAKRVEERLTRQQWLQLKAALEERIAAGESVTNILTDVQQ